MKSRQSSAIPPRILTVSLVILVASALLATLLVASILYSDRKNGEVATLRAEIEALKQEQELVQRNVATLTDKVESLEKAVSSQISMNVTTLGTDIEALRRDQMIIRSEIEALASEMESLKNARMEEEISSAEVKLDVPRYKQAHSLTCESSAASMVANFYRIPLSEEEIIEALPRDEDPPGLQRQAGRRPWRLDRLRGIRRAHQRNPGSERPGGHLRRGWVGWNRESS